MTGKTLPTAGEWTAAVAKFKGGDYIGVGVLGTQKIVAICGLCEAEDEAESIANAQLIEAAPKLLEALKNYVTVIATAGGGDKQLFMAAIRDADNKAREVIAKATGEAQ